MDTRRRSPNGTLFVALAAAIVTACSDGEKGVIHAQVGDAVIVLSEGECAVTCPVYDMTLHPDGKYLLNGVRFVRSSGISEGNIGQGAWTAAEKVLADAGFWTLEPQQTAETLTNCKNGAPTAKVTWRTKEGKEKTVTYYAGCGVRKMEDLIRTLRAALDFEYLVWTDARFDPSGNR
jgi:hypothetical protein